MDMASHQSKQAVQEEEEGGLFEPLNPSSQCLNSSLFSVSIVAFAESEIPIDESKVLEGLRTDLFPVNKGFSSIVVTDRKGLQWWKKVHVQVEDHVTIPTFPVGLTPEAYDQHFKDYLSKMAIEEFPKNQPLWAVHIFKYPRPGSAGTMVFKLHHAIGDGFSLMGAVFSCFKRADNPSLPLTFPSAAKPTQSEEMIMWKKVLNGASGLWRTISDFAWGLLYSTLLEDSLSAVRSGDPHVGFKPINLTWATFSLDDIRQIKFKIGGTVNDVLVGLLCYAVHLYSEEVAKNSSSSRKTALVLLNLRMVKGYRNLEEMHNNDMWGNFFSFIHVPVPTSSDGGEANPLTFIFNAKETIKRKSRSMDVFLNAFLLKMLAILKGHQAMSKYMYSTVTKSTMIISNLAGPTEEMQIVDHPINGIHFALVGVPQSLLFTILSYNGKVDVMVTSEKGFINAQLLVSCLNKSFKKIFEAACNMNSMESN